MHVGVLMAWTRSAYACIYLCMYLCMYVCLCKVHVVALTLKTGHIHIHIPQGHAEFLEFRAVFERMWDRLLQAAECVKLMQVCMCLCICVCIYIYMG